MMDDTPDHSFDFSAPSDEETGGESTLESRVLEALRTVFDPEIPVNLVELGLIYDLKVDEAGKVAIEMTLTTPSCPVAGNLPREVQRAAEGVEGVTEANVELVWEPSWNPGMMSEAARLELGFM